MTDREGSTDPVASAATNPLSRKLNKILETRLDNDKVWFDLLHAMIALFSVTGTLYDIMDFQYWFYDIILFLYRFLFLITILTEKT